MKICSVEGCGGRIASLGMCQKHYIRTRKYGSPLATHDRWKRKRKWLEANCGFSGDECLRWPFSVSAHGRGTVQVDGRSMSAPRFMCYLAHGEPPSPKHHASHTCGKGHEGCVNPRHLVWKTPKQNEADKIAHGTIRRGSDINTSKLSERDVRRIRDEIAMGRKGIDIAREFGVTPAMVSNIKAGKAWAWLS